MAFIGDPFHIVGNVVADPELKTLPTGHTVLNMTIAMNEFNKNKPEGQGTKAVFARCHLWVGSRENPEKNRAYAENIAASLKKGQQVIAVVNMDPTSRKLRDENGAEVNVSGVEYNIREIGPALRFGVSQFAPNPRNGGGFATPPDDAYQQGGQPQQQGGGWGGQQQGGGQPQQGQPQQQGGGWGGQQQGGGQPQQQGGGQPAQNDPWGGAGGWGNNAPSNEPPF